MRRIVCRTSSSAVDVTVHVFNTTTSAWRKSLTEESPRAARPDSSAAPGFAQVSTGAGTVEGTVVDPTGALVPSATVTLSNPVSGYTRTVTTGEDGSFAFHNIPPNPYHVQVTAQGFSPKSQDVEVRSSVPVTISFKLELAGETTQVNV